MSGGDSREQIDQAEAARRRLVEAAKQGEFYEVGRQAADVLLREEEVRRQQAVYQRGVQDALALETQRKQEAIDQEAQRYSEAVLEAAQQRLEADPDHDPRDFDGAAARWRTYAQEEARKREVTRLTDAQIAQLEPEEWLKVYDVERGTFRTGYAHDPGDGGGYGAINGAAAGLSGSSLDLTRYPG